MKDIYKKQVSLLLEILPEIAKLQSFHTLFGEDNTMVNKGNRDIIRKINLIDNKIKNAQNELFQFTQSDINYLIHNELNAITAEFNKKNGEPYIYIGLLK